MINEKRTLRRSLFCAKKDLSNGICHIEKQSRTDDVEVLKRLLQ